MRTTLFLLPAIACFAQAGKVVPLPFALTPRAHQAHHGIHLRSNASSRATLTRRQGPARLDRRALDVTLLLGQLQSLCGGLSSSQQDISHTRQEIANNPKKGAKYSHELSNKLAAMREASGGATPIISDLDKALAPFGANKGKTYYDHTNALEVLVKDLVDANKYALADVDYIIYQVPGLGPVLGPIVYDLKCVIEDLLNGLENTVDGVLSGKGLAGLQGLLGSFKGILGINGLLAGLNLGGRA